MALLGSLSSKILSTLVLGVAGSGAITGAVMATRNREIVNNVEKVIQEYGNEGMGDKGDSSEEERGEEKLKRLGEQQQEDQSLERSDPSTKDISMEESKNEDSEGIKDVASVIVQQYFVEQEEVKDDILGPKINNEPQEDLRGEYKLSDEPEPEKESEDSKKQREREEIDQLGVRLETVWIYGESNSKYRVCEFLSKNDGKDTTILMYLLESDNDDECEKQTVWSENRHISDLGENKEAIWVRGEGKEVKKFIEKNWEDSIKSSGYVDKEKKNPENDEQRLSEIDLENNSCKIDYQSWSEHQDWMELTCILREYKNSKTFNR
ncbi:hypothetical protein MSUIS_00410 [Mycoplasma suis KI3806]|uniref:Uncharacterized protein n=1 Tax=Mycoplasma suis (strain KI_3806) TaxID=708248 RepID=F0V2R2_MYCS3|nr:hypothetical protein [Mycoplasma suis]CBZ40134.1 hypothetical protein MSUIS_00410 [Mycoplasma suis KI3806]